MAPQLTPRPLRVAIRALILRVGETLKAKKSPPPGGGWPETVLVLDTETTTDPSQRLLFGVYRFGAWQPDGTLQGLEEGLFYDDELSMLRPEEFGLLCSYVETHRGGSAGEGPLQLMSRRAFVNDRLWKAVEQGSLIAGFNLPFDLSRLAVDARKPKPTMFAGGFTQPLFEWQDRHGVYRPNGYRPWFRYKPIDRNRALMGWTGYRGPTGPAIHRPEGLGPLLDLKALTFALTGQGHSLDGAARRFGLPIAKQGVEEHGTITPRYVGYGRQDVAVTWHLLEALRAEWDRHPITVSPNRALSPTAMAKGYLRAMGVAPPVSKTSEVTAIDLGPWMNGYYGGRTEVRIRRVPVPVVYLDFLSMYPTVNVLLGLWPMVTAATLRVQDATTRIRELVQSVTLEQCFDPTFWSTMCFIARINPEGDVLPIRGFYDEASVVPTIGVNTVQSPDQDLWIPGPDLVASILLSGHVPHVLEARALVGEGQQEGLQPTRLRGRVPIDPTTDDFYQRLIEVRNQIRRGMTPESGEEADRLQEALKVVANVTAYGVAAQLDRPVIPGREHEPVTVYGIGGIFASTTNAHEEPGEYFFPPFATLITAGARLMLAMLERLVTDAGGQTAFGDTDSGAIVATEHGGFVPCPGGPLRGPDGTPGIQALTWGQVRGFVDAFTALNPYDREAVPGSILKIESVNFSVDGTQRPLWAYAISAKRYALFTRTESGDPQVVVAKEHGLGHLMNPGSTIPQPQDAEADAGADAGSDAGSDAGPDEENEVESEVENEDMRGDTPKVIHTGIEGESGAGTGGPSGQTYQGNVPDDEGANEENVEGNVEGNDEGNDEPDAGGGEGRPWVRELVWTPLIRQALGLPTSLLHAVDLPAVTRLGVTRTAFLDAFAAINEGKPYAEQIKPTNFALSVHVAPFGHPAGVDPQRFHLFGPFERDSAKWLGQPWYDKYSKKRYRIGVGPDVDAGIVRVKSYRDLIEEYATHPESKSLGPDGRPCHRQTVGLLRRQVIDIAEAVYVGKESNQLEEAKAGLVHDIRDVLEHHHPTHDSRWWRIVVPALRHIPAARLVTVAACTPRYVRMLLRGTRQPSATVGVRLWYEAWRWAKRAVARRAAPEAVRRAGTRLLGLGPPPRVARGGRGPRGRPRARHHR